LSGAWQRQYLGQKGATFGQMAMKEPESTKRSRETLGIGQRACVDQPTQGCAEIVVLALESIQPAAFVWSQHGGGRALSQGGEESRVPIPPSLSIGALIQPFSRELPQRLQQAIAQATVARFGQDQRIVDQVAEQI
jgi:hypothetical protein